MRNPKYLVIAALAATMTLTTACSFKADSGGGSPSNPPAPPQKLSDDFAGAWVSDCMLYPLGHSVYHIKELAIEGSDMTYVESFYRDAACEQENEDRREVLEGSYELSQALSDGRNLIEMKIPVNTNVWAIREFNLKKDGEFLFMSGFFQSSFDDPEAVSVRYKLSKVEEEGEKKEGGSQDEDGDQEGGDDGRLINDLRGGVYVVESGFDGFCNQMVSGTGKQDGRLFMVSITLMGECSGTLNMMCENNVCVDSGSTLTLKSETSYEFENSRGRKALFRKR